MADVPRTITASSNGHPPMNTIHVQALPSVTSTALPFRDKTHESSNINPSITKKKQSTVQRYLYHPNKKLSLTSLLSNDDTQNAVTANTRYKKENNPSFSSPHSSDKETIFQLQLEIESLRQKLRLFDTSKSGSTSKEELLSLLSEKDSVIETKTNQINTLSSKFQKITHAVSRMELEAKNLQQQNDTLTKEHKKIHRHLSIREKEVNVLVTRCATQEEKLMDAKELRILETENATLQSTLDAKRKDYNELQSSFLQLQKNQEKDKNRHSSEIQRLNLDNEARVEQIRRTVLNLETILESEKGMSANLEKRLETAMSMHEEERTQANEDLSNAHKTAKEEYDKLLQHQQQILQSRKEENARRMLALEDKHREKCDMLESSISSQKKEIQSIHKDLQQMKDRNNELKGRLKISETKQEELSSNYHEDTASHQQVQRQLQNEINAKNSMIQELQTEMKMAKEEYQLNTRESQQHIDTRIKSYETQLSAMKEQEEEKKRELHETYNRITELCEKVKMYDNNEEIHKRQIKSYKEQLVVVNDSLQKRSKENEQCQHTMKENKDNYDKKCINLENTYKAELQQVKAEMSKQMEDFQTEKDWLTREQNEKQLQIQKLEDVELKSWKDTVEELKKELESKQGVLEQTEMEAAEIVDELTNKVDNITNQYARLEQKKTDEVVEIKKAKDEALRKYKLIDSELTKIKEELLVKHREATDSKSAAEKIKKSKGEQDEQLQSIRQELEVLINAYDKAKEEHKRAKGALETQVKILKERLSKEEETYTKDYTELQKIATVAEEEMDKKSEQLESLQQELGERMELLSSMVEHNKELEKDSEAGRALVTELQEESESLVTEIGQLKQKCLAHEKSSNKDKVEFDSLMQKERAARQRLESESNKLRNELNDKINEGLDYDEVKAENYLLKDKIERQENYLKKKLKQDRNSKKLGMRKRSPTPTRASGAAIPPTRKTTSRKYTTGRRSVAQTSSMDEEGSIVSGIGSIQPSFSRSAEDDELSMILDDDLDDV